MKKYTDEFIAFQKENIRDAIEDLQSYLEQIVEHTDYLEHFGDEDSKYIYELHGLLNIGLCFGEEDEE